VAGCCMTIRSLTLNAPCPGVLASAAILLCCLVCQCMLPVIGLYGSQSLACQPVCITTTSGGIAKAHLPTWVLWLPPGAAVVQDGWQHCWQQCAMQQLLLWFPSACAHAASAMSCSLMCWVWGAIFSDVIQCCKWEWVCHVSAFSLAPAAAYGNAISASWFSYEGLPWLCSRLACRPVILHHDRAC
jgi:hypothetical protein